MGEGLIVSRGVWKRFGSTIALRDINLSIGEGLHLLLGPNGSGKSTFLKLSCGLIKPTKGNISTLGLNPWRDRVELSRKIGVAFEDTALPDWLSGKDFLRYVVERRRSDWSMMLERARELGVTEYWDNMIRGYSSGMRKKIILLAAMGWEPEILMLDEPYTLLDRNSIETINDMLIRMMERCRLILIASHIFSGLERHVSSLTILFDGQVILHGAIDDKTLEEYQIYSCVAEDPLPILQMLYEYGVREVWLQGKTIFFRAPLPKNIHKQIELTKILDVRRLYEEVIVGSKSIN